MYIQKEEDFVNVSFKSRKEIYYMKRGHVVARKRFINKYGNNLINGFLVLSIMLCLGTFLTTNGVFANMNTTTAKANSNNSGVQLMEIASYSENEVVTIDGMRYYLEDAQNIIETISGENVVYKAVLVNGKCTSIMTSIED